ncbi:N-acetyltransferase [Pseudoalteromonas luteoviolacea]|uniref:N-acetyltransferase n=1 Tax=Pseudoalteromonas luteoviolacea TaxID=43657 RepID=UPI001153E167|nr:N-acetyltransferase [Pseudoalteromonas luteoviolacea]TQF67669.1 N-acetyltransferase [Pseudoalteromonas luteoviolacea]
MIRKSCEADIEAVLLVWLAASERAHHFVPAAFWREQLDSMKHVYLPSSRNYVYIKDSKIIGFYALLDDTLAAIFVLPERQGQGIGKQLIADAKSRCHSLQLAVYKRNLASVEFYKKQGFEIAGEELEELTGQQQLIMRWQNTVGV